MTPSSSQSRVDHSALRVNQIAIVSVTALAFVVDQPLLLAVLAFILAVGSALPALSLSGALYRTVIRPRGWLKPDLRDESPAPHRFAQAVGAAFLTAGFLALLSGAPTLGWLLSAVVVVLASVNLFSGFCAGCFVYFQLSRLRARILR